MTLIASDDLTHIMPVLSRQVADKFVDSINAVMNTYNIDSVYRCAAFLANVAEETQQLRYLAEIWGPTLSQAHYDPPGPLAKGLGNIYAGDGKLYRGRGLLMITGRDNYTRASTAIASNMGYDLVKTPDLVATDMFLAASTAGWFWSERGLNEIADMGDIRAVTIAINGGTNGLSNRINYYQAALGCLQIST